MRSIPEAAVSWSEIPVERVSDLVTRQVVDGRRFTLLRYVYQPGAVFPEHRHPQEQATLVLSGTLEFTVGGRAITVGPGTLLRLDPGTPHGARVVGGEPATSLNFFSPARSEHPDVH